jgi:hypothetical protein
VEPHRGARLGVSGGDLVPRRSTPASSIVVTKVHLSMCGCMRAIGTPRRPGGDAAVASPRAGPAAAPVQRDRPGDAVADGAVDCARDEHVLDDLAVLEQPDLRGS